MELLCTEPLTVLWFGGGQDSTALLWLSVFDEAFRAKYVKGKLIVVMSDTGNEYPYTYLHVQRIQALSHLFGYEFHFLTPDMGYHCPTWHTLGAQMERCNNIMGVAFPKPCTDNLKIKVCYRFLEQYLRVRYGFTRPGKNVFYEYANHFGPLTSWIGFAAGEEKRCAKPVVQLDMFKKHKDPRPVWMRTNIQHIYPLIELGLTRLGCQELIRAFDQFVPPPSNCMMCPYQNPVEMVYLERFFQPTLDYWVQREEAKLARCADQPRNLGVKGDTTLPAFMEGARATFGHLTDEELYNHRMTHGHSVSSKY